MRFDEEDSFEESIRLRDGTEVVLLVYTREPGTADFILSIAPRGEEGVTFRQTVQGDIYEGVRAARRALVQFIEQRAKRALHRRQARRKGFNGLFRSMFR